MMREKSPSSPARRALWTFAFVLFATSAAYADSLIGVNAYSFQNDHRHLVVIDPATGALLGGHDITLAGRMVQQPTALAADPTTGVLYALLTIADYEGRSQLVTVDPATGVATDVGNTNERIRSLTFKPDGTLLGITSPYDPSSTPVTLFTIDKATAVATPVCNPTGADDYVIAYDSDDSQLYYATGTDGTKVFQTLDQSSCAPTNIGYTGGSAGPVTALLYDMAGDAFLAADDGTLSVVTPSGGVSAIGPLTFPDSASATIRGFAWTNADLAFGDVAVYGSIDPDTIPPGGATTMTLNVVNTGSTPLTGVEGRVGGHGVLDMVGYSGDATCSASGLEFVCEFGDLAIGATETVIINFTADIPSDSGRMSIPIWARANEYDTHPNDNFGRINIYRAAEGCTGGFLLTSELRSGDPSPAPGYSGSWTFRITAQNCTGGALAGVKIQGGTNGWGHYVSRSASSGTTSMKVNRRAEVITWKVNLDNGEQATLDVTMSGAISAHHVCSPDVSTPVFGSVEYLSGIWSATHRTIARVETGGVSIVVECP